MEISSGSDLLRSRYSQFLRIFFFFLLAPLITLKKIGRYKMLLWYTNRIFLFFSFFWKINNNNNILKPAINHRCILKCSSVCENTGAHFLILIFWWYTLSEDKLGAFYSNHGGIRLLNVPISTERIMVPLVR